MPPPPKVSGRQEAERLAADSARLRDKAWASLDDSEKVYFAKFYFELLDPDKRDEVWGFCDPQDRFAILSQPHYWSGVEDQSRDQSLGFIKGRDSLERSAYFNLLRDDGQKNEAWALLPEPTANDWHDPWGPEAPDGIANTGEQRLPYFHNLALADWRARIGRHETDEGELWGLLNTENRRKYFNFFPSFCNGNQKSEVWRHLDDEEKALLVAKAPFSWTAFMLFEGGAEALHGEEGAEAWELLDDKSKVCVMMWSAPSISDTQRDEAWGLADRGAKTVAFTHWFWSLSDGQKQEAWDSMTKREREHAAAVCGFAPS